MTPRLTLAPCAGEPELADPAFAGDWATELAKMSAAANIAPWCSYLARRDGEPVGIGGFKASPDSAGCVEIAYLTFLPAQRQGIASTVAGELTSIAKANGARTACAHTLPETNPSTRVLRANGFTMTGEVVDPEDGPVWRWEREL